MTTKENLLLLLDHPTEPVFMDKGKTPTVFEVPESYLTDRFKHTDIQNAIPDTVEKRIRVKEIEIPDLSLPTSLSRDQQFSLFIPRHRRIARRLMDIFLKADTIDDLQSIAVYSRDRVNPLLFNYALSVALLHRPDTRDIDLPSFLEAFPDKFVDSQVFGQMREEINVVPNGLRMPISIPRDYTASELEPEHTLWYFREDVGVNLHHWHWHLVYPFESSDIKIVAKDRRGELFFYMHQQMVVRYNLERFSNNMPRVVSFANLREPITEGYFPKLDSKVMGRAWPPRPRAQRLSDLNRKLDEINLNVEVLEHWRDLFLKAIDDGYVIDANGERIELDEKRGIDILGNMMESSMASPNRDFYGDFHNMGHVFISFAHDPDQRHLESFGIMAESATAMRDPVFYRWHAYIDEMFQVYKKRLPPYEASALNYEGISITDLQVDSENEEKNIFTTFWQQSDVDFSRGMDFAPRGNVFTRFTHLQHTPFLYTIKVYNDSDVMRQGMVRIFMGPKTDEKLQPMPLSEQRLFMAELDKFVVTLSPGLNVVRRRSTESSVTIPFERTFRNVDLIRPNRGVEAELPFNFCGCGWPNHMLIAKGKPEGLPCELFVMISNYEEDRVDQDLVGTCSTAASYCGVRDRLYPDKRHMGYPFDRLPRAGADSLKSFLTPNMGVVDVLIRHENRTTIRPNKSL